MAEVEPGYEPLFDELMHALEQSQGGKGKERHANDRPFLQQPIMEMGRMCGPGGPAQQVMKKTQEALGMVNRGEHDRAIAELHGAIVYAAACAMLIRENKPNMAYTEISIDDPHDITCELMDRIKN